MPPAGQHFADTASGVGEISGTPGDNMNMQMHYCLTGGSAFVYADIKPVRAVFFLDYHFCLSD